MGFYLRCYLATLLLIFVLVAAVNAVVDPHARIMAYIEPGFNQLKPALKRDSRKAKAYALRFCEFNVVAVGTSRAETSLSMEDLHFAGGKAYNAALKAGSMYEIRRMIEYALRYQNLNEVILSLDFVAFDEGLIFEADFEDSPLAENISLASWLQYLLSIRTFYESLITIDINRQGGYQVCADSGQHQRRKELKPAREAFDGIMKQYSRGPYKRHITGENHLENLKAILAELSAAGVNVYAYISPLHVVHLELLKEMGRLQDFNDWKRDLVKIFESPDLPKSPEHVLVLWDFSGYNRITTEFVPENAEDGFMKWYLDSSHANSLVGGMILDRMLTDPVAKSEPGAFGVRLTSKNIESVIKYSERASLEYQQKYPREIKRIRSFVTPISATGDAN